MSASAAALAAPPAQAAQDKGPKCKVAEHHALLLEPLHVHRDVGRCVCCFGCCVATKYVLAFSTCGGSVMAMRVLVW